MTPKEFKAWFDGFTEAISEPPTEKQWERIKARVAEIDGTQISYPVYVDRYLARAPYYYGTPIVMCSGTSMSAAAATSFDSVNAMYTSGKSDFEAT